MHKTIDDILKKINNDIFLLVDGNDFKPYTKFINNEIKQLPYICIKGGDNKYCAIAAASILAKVARDEYIEDLCKKNEYLNTYYDIGNNKGYGTKKHLDGINKYGITKWHRKTYGICKHAPEINI